MARVAATASDTTSEKTPSCPVSRLGREVMPPVVVPYGPLETWITCAPACSTPSGVVKRRSKGWAPGPSISGSAASVVSRLASRYSGDRTMVA